MSGAETTTEDRVTCMEQQIERLQRYLCSFPQTSSSPSDLYGRFVIAQILKEKRNQLNVIRASGRR